ncbi:MAG: tetratricopeptide repeat protein [Elusimicrobiota bacterium]
MSRRPPPSASGEPASAGAARAAFLCLTTLAAFWPSLRNGFVNWDDGANLVENFNYRGLGWTQLRWMWTTFHMGHYQPLSWMSLGLDYLAWGMNPFGYHLSSLLLHCANAVLFYFVAVRLLRGAAAGAPGERGAAGSAALLAALLFAVHPLRVESVVWATERRDVLSGLFYLAAVLFYLQARDAPQGRPSRRKLRAAAACGLLSLLSKAIGMTLPAALVVLDVYPLRRLPFDPTRWFEREARGVLGEKVPFAAISLPFAVAAFLAQRHTGVIAHFASAGLVERLATAAFGAAFYLFKTLVPRHLLPLYSRPVAFHAGAPRFLGAAAVVAAVSAGAFLARRRWPGLAAAWIYYLATLAPVLGVVLSGIYLAADRYTYLPCLAWALLAAAAAARVYLRSGRLGRAASACAAGLIVAGLVSLTRGQCRIWRDSVGLWTYTTSVEPDSAPAHDNLGTALARSGREADAVLEFQSAVRLDPNDPEARNNLATAWVRSGRWEDGIVEYRAALRADPAYAMARDNLGAVLAAQGKTEEAIAEYRRALAVNPGDAHAHNNLGAALAGQGRSADAAAEFRRALELSPNYAEAANHLRALSIETSGGAAPH